MRTIQHGEHEIVLYNGAENMPMKRYQRFNKFLMVANEVGSDFEDYNKRMLKSIQYLKKKMFNQAVQELENQRQMVYNSFMEYSPTHRALAILVYSIDGQVYKDISSDGLQVVIDRLDEIGFTQAMTSSNVEEVKKKSKKNWLRIFRITSKG